jgi:hypothetical protein
MLAQLPSKLDRRWCVMNDSPQIPSTVDLHQFLPAMGNPIFSLWRRLFRGMQLILRASDWDRYAGEGWEKRIMLEPATDRLHSKQGRSIGRRVFANGNEQLSVYLKRHYRLPWWKAVLATFLPQRPWSPGLQEWQHLIWAVGQGIPVPRPVAAGQTVGPWFKLQSFLAVEELHGMVPLHEAVVLAAKQLEPTRFAQWKRGLITELARLTHELHCRKVFHKDLYLCHFYILETDTQRLHQNWANRVVVIDLHRLAHHRLTALWWQAKDLAQLLYSSQVASVTNRDRIRFWKLYRSSLRAGSSSKWLLTLIRWKFRFYQRHEHRRRLGYSRKE